MTSSTHGGHFITESEVLAGQSDNFKKFEEYCCLSYNLLRREGHRLINMFLIMLSAGMPELSSNKDIAFLVRRLNLQMTEVSHLIYNSIQQEASELFKKEIVRAMNTWFRRVDNLAHNYKAMKKA